MRYFFILGCPRSGTTLLHVMLGRHREVLVSPETKLFYYYNRAPSWMARRALRRIEVDLNIKLSGSRPGDPLLPVTEVLRSVAAQYRTLINKPDAQVFGEKTPEHSSRVREMLRCLPDAKFVVVVRDGRDVARSLMQVPWIHCDLLAGMAVWKRYVKQLNQWRNHPSFLFLRFEDLVQFPAKAIGKVFMHLGLETDEDVVAGQGDRCQTIPQREMCWKARALTPPAVGNAYRWTVSMSSFDANRLESLAVDELRSFGYSVSNDLTRPTIGLRVRELISIAKMLRRLPPESLWAEFLGCTPFIPRCPKPVRE